MNKKDFKAKIDQLEGELLQKTKEIRILEKKIEFLNANLESEELQHKECEERLRRDLREIREKHAALLEKHIELLDRYSSALVKVQSQRQSQGDEP